MLRKICMGLLMAVCPFMVANAARDAACPTHTVKLVVPFPAGGRVDNLARQLAEKLSAEWKQSVVVENKPGALAIIAASAVTNSRDGHTLLEAAGLARQGPM